MIGKFSRMIRDERGATAVEYGLIIALVVLAMVGMISNVADITTEMWNGVAEKVVQE